MYSWEGYFNFVADWFGVWFNGLLSFFGFPLNIWLALFDGADVSDMWIYFVFYQNPFAAPWAHLLHVTMNNGWAIM